MKITFYLRDLRQGNYSIEKIFHAVADQLKDQSEISFFYVDSSKGFLRNLLSARKAQGDVNHITGDVNWLIFGLDKRKTIITVHDLGHFENTLTGLKKWIYKHLWLLIPFKKAQLLTSISEFTKSRIKYHFGFHQKIVVIHNPLIQNKSSIVKRAFNQEKPNILQIGIMQNKNLERLIHAAKDLDCHLILIRDLDETTKQQLRQKKISFECYSDVSEELLQELYLRTDILFFASTYEGFGLPIIEAQAYRIPVITSNLCSMPEVAGHNSLLVDPYSVNAIRDGLRKIINNESFREDLVRHGEENVKRFKIEIISRKYLQLYHRVHEN